MLQASNSSASQIQTVCCKSSLSKITQRSIFWIKNMQNLKKNNISILLIYTMIFQKLISQIFTIQNSQTQKLTKQCQVVRYWLLVLVLVCQFKEFGGTSTTFDIWKQNPLYRFSSKNNPYSLMKKYCAHQFFSSRFPFTKQKVFPIYSI